MNTGKARIKMSICCQWMVRKPQDCPKEDSEKSSCIYTEKFNQDLCNTD